MHHQSRVHRTQIHIYSYRYNDLLTPFAFKKLQLQHELSDVIEFIVMRDDSAVTEKSNGNGHSVSDQHCTCLYFSSMQMPCRHLFQFWKTKKINLFQPFLCAKRWTKSYYYTSHPAINSMQPLPPHQPIHVTRVRVPAEIEKYKKSATATKEINNLVSNMSNSQFDYFMGKINEIRSEMISESSVVQPTNRQAETSQDIVQQNQVENLAQKKYSVRPCNQRQQFLSQIANIPTEPTATQPGDQLPVSVSCPLQFGPITVQQSDDQLPLSAQHPSQCAPRTTQPPTDELPVSVPYPSQVGPTTAQQSGHPSQLAPIITQQPAHFPQHITSIVGKSADSIPIADQSNGSVSQSTTYQLENSSQMTSSTFQRVILPTRKKAIGRPKGSGNTVIGLKAKTPVKSQNTRNNSAPASKRKPQTPSQAETPTPLKKTRFVDKTKEDQGIIIATWLTNWSTTQIGKKKITLGDIIQDMHTFDRLRHKEVNLECIKSHVDKKAFAYIVDEVDRLEEKPFTCRKCRKLLSGIKVMCHGCLDWYHSKCIKTKNIEYFCEDC